MTGRAVAEWIGKTPDTAVPERVQRRVFDAHFGRCHITGTIIDPIRDEWQIEHKIALCNGGENRESNLGPALIAPHVEKTARDRADKDKVERVRRKHLGIRDKKWRRSIPGSRDTPFKQRMNGRTERRA